MSRGSQRPQQWLLGGAAAGRLWRRANGCLDRRPQLEDSFRDTIEPVLERFTKWRRSLPPTARQRRFVLVQMCASAREPDRRRPPKPRGGS